MIIFDYKPWIVFFKLDNHALQTIQETTAGLDLFYALSLRLGIIYHLQNESKQAFKYLVIFPSEILDWYQFQEFIKISNLPYFNHFAPLFIWSLFQKSEFTLHKKDQEILLILSILACYDQNEINQPAYLNLLQYYLNEKKMVTSYSMILKIRNLDTKPAKSCLPMDNIIKAFSTANQADFQFEQLIK